MSYRTADHPGSISSLQAPEQRSERVKLRRALAFLAMTVVLPGSAQLAAGHKRLGRVALRAWAALWVLALVVGVAGLLWRRAAVAALTTGFTVALLQVLLVVLGIGWTLLLIDAWRIAHPPELTRRHRIGVTMLSLVLVFSIVGGLIASASMISAQRDLLTTVFAGGGDAAAKDGRYNILLLGGDAGRDRTGLRPDSLTVASVDAATGRTVLVSLPRNLEDVPFPTSSPLHGKFPRGFGCPDHSCMLNAVYTYAASHPQLYPGVENPGVQATKEAVEGATGLAINYWVLVDLKGFESLVDAVGGITMDVAKRVPIGGGTSRIYGYIEPGRRVHLDGFHALWFARSRSGASDYERMARQKCVMSAMLNQLDPVTVLTKFNSIASAGKQIVATDIPTSNIAMLMDLARKARDLPVASLAFVPPLVQPGSPDFDRMHRAVQAKVAAAEAADARATAPPSPAQPSSAASRKSKPQSSVPSGSDTEDLAAVCRAR